MIPIQPDASRVRIATRRDEDELVELCRREHAENGGRYFSPDKVRSLMWRAFNPAGNEPAVIGVTGEKVIQGSLCVVIDAPWNSDTPFLRVLWNYVLPEYRRLSASKDLLAFAGRLSEPSPVGYGRPVRLEVPASPKAQGQVRMFNRQLGEPAGFTWMCGVNAAGEI